MDSPTALASLRDAVKASLTAVSELRHTKTQARELQSGRKYSPIRFGNSDQSRDRRLAAKRIIATHAKSIAVWLESRAIDSTAMFGLDATMAWPNNSNEDEAVTALAALLGRADAVLAAAHTVEVEPGHDGLSDVLNWLQARRRELNIGGPSVFPKSRLHDFLIERKLPISQIISECFALGWITEAPYPLPSDDRVTGTFSAVAAQMLGASHYVASVSGYRILDAVLSARITTSGANMIGQKAIKIQRRGRRPNRERDEAILKADESGQYSTRRAVAEQFGISPGAVTKAIARAKAWRDARRS